MHEQIFLLLGTNLGDKNENLAKAIDAIALFGQIKQKSSVYKTSAWGKTDQPDFYNQVIEIETLLTPHALLQRILEIETQMGRARLEKWGERLIDIDILLFNNEVIDSDALQVPHPQMINRKFTLVPLAEIAGDVIHPVYKQTISELLTACLDPLDVALVR